jgi:ribosome recycling factor
MSDARITTFKSDGDRILTYLSQEFGKLQTGRANAAVVEHVNVEAYGQNMQLKAVASISVQDARTIVIQPWDRSVLGAVEKALQQSDLGINPVNDGVVIRLNLPPMTEERRSDLKKIVQKLSEEARISLRQARQKSHDEIKADKDEDIRESLTEALQKEVDAYNAKIDELKKHKEEEVMKV